MNAIVTADPRHSPKHPPISSCASSPTMNADSTPGYPVLPPHELPLQPEERRWLVENLWMGGSVGLIGGQPKTFKTFLGMDLAVSVASGTPCLRTYPVPNPGPVLLFAAEDALHIVRRRIEGICIAAGCSLKQLDLHVITVPTVRLDLPADRDRLLQTVERIKPRLLLLDPFVRLHRIDENISGEVAPLLAYLRELQRCHDLAVVLVHHARKGNGNSRAGQELRGTSEFHAWGDSNLYMRRDEQELTLTIEHRAAPSPVPIALELHQSGDALALQPQTCCASTPLPEASLDARITQALESAGRPMSPSELRGLCRVRNATLHERLAAMIQAGLLLRDAHGYRLAAQPSASDD
jgi:hypothetical protein